MYIFDKMGPMDATDEKKRKWTQDLTKLFLEIYEQYPCLWDIKCADYRDKDKKDLAFSNVVGSMVSFVPDFDILSAKSKIKSIRNAYAAELQKVSRSKKNLAPGDEVYKPSAIWFETADRILRDVVQAQYNKPLALPAKTNNFDGDGVMEEDVSVTSHTDDENESVFKRPPSSRQLDTDVQPSPPKRKKSSNCNLSKVNETLTMLKELSSVVTNCDDELDIFGRSVVGHLRNLPLCKALECQAFIQNYLIQQRINHLKSPPPRPESSLSSVNYMSPMSPFYQQSEYNSNESSMSYE